MDLFDKIVTAVIGLLLTIIGFFIKGRDQKLKEVVDQMNLLALQKVDKDVLESHEREQSHKFELLQSKLRDDVINLHEKIEVGNRDLNQKIDINQRDTNNRLDRILEAVNK